MVYCSFCIEMCFILFSCASERKKKNAECFSWIIFNKSAGHVSYTLIHTEIKFGMNTDHMMDLDDFQSINFVKSETIDLFFLLLLPLECFFFMSFDFFIFFTCVSKWNYSGNECTFLPRLKTFHVYSLLS